VNTERFIKICFLYFYGDSMYSEVGSVRSRLEEWRDYFENRSNFTPGAPYSVADEVADAIYQARKPIRSSTLPDPTLNLNVPDSAIQDALRKARAGEKYIFF
jgi:hypothetical protein